MKIRARLACRQGTTLINKHPRRQGKQEKCNCGSGKTFRKCCGIGNRDKAPFSF